jgi:hypothetical protein
MSMNANPYTTRRSVSPMFMALFLALILAFAGLIAYAAIAGNWYYAHTSNTTISVIAPPEHQTGGGPNASAQPSARTQPMASAYPV